MSELVVFVSILPDLLISPYGKRKSLTCERNWESVRSLSNAYEVTVVDLTTS